MAQILKLIKKITEHLDDKGSKFGGLVQSL